MRFGPLVGRDAEFAVLAARLAAVRAGGSGVVFVAGEPGIGKTRLVDEAAEEARRRGLRVLRGRAVGAVAAGDSRMRPFAEALLGLAREGWSPPDGLGPYLAVLGQLVPDWRTDGRTSSPAPPFIYGEAILRVLGGLGGPGTVLVIEDLHDADQDTIATLEYLVDNAAGQPLAIFCTARDASGRARDLAEYARRRDPGAQLDLPRLDRAATAELAGTLLDTDRDGLDPELSDALFRDGVGNPLVITEILRELVASNELVRRDGAWTLRQPGLPRAPRSLALSVADQLRREQPAARRVLQAAATLGDEFPADLLGSIAGVDDETLRLALHSAVQGHLLVATARDDWFAFRHPLIERAVYNQLAPADRASLALTAAAAIESRGAVGSWRIRAAALRESAGDELGASALFGAAGRAAAESGAPGPAVDLLRRALGCLPSDRRDATWVELTGLLVTALGVVGRDQEALDLVPEIEAAERAGLAREASADLRLRLARVALRAGRSEHVSPHLDAARQRLSDLPDAAEWAELEAIEAYLAVERNMPGLITEAEEHAQQAIARARAAGLPLVECDALLTLGYHYGNYRPVQALESYQQAYQVAHENNIISLRSESVLLLGAHQWMWHADATGLRTAEAEATSDGAVLETRMAQISLAVDALFSADFDEADRWFRTAWDDIARLKLPRLGCYALAMKAVTCAHRGHDVELAAAIEEFDAWRGESEDEVPLVRGLALAMSELLRGDTATAREHLAALYAPDGGFAATKYYLCGEFGLAALVEAVDGGGTAGGWERYRETVAQTAAGLPWNRQFVEFALAVLAGRDRQLADAEAALARAEATSRPFPLVRHLALSLIAADAARDGWGEPIRWLREAEAFFKGVGITAAARKCRDRLRLLGEATRQWRDGSPDVPHELWALGVTAREYEVLKLVARHQTNREIAAKLHVSHRTIDRHVANLLAKTGKANRRELAAVLVTH
ncbi:MAG TPA: AAA family ATPase [Actinospica sp.]|nr:AAA family ATPase [Actinospica sp.]